VGVTLVYRGYHRLKRRLFSHHEMAVDIFDAQPFTLATNP
jgi:hypothetical protein